MGLNLVEMKKNGRLIRNETNQEQETGFCVFELLKLEHDSLRKLKSGKFNVSERSVYKWRSQHRVSY